MAWCSSWASQMYKNPGQAIRSAMFNTNRMNVITDRVSVFAYCVRSVLVPNPINDGGPKYQ